MRTYLIGILLCMVVYSSNAQYITGNPPLVEWSKTDIWPLYPPIYSTPLPGGGLSAEKSGEDWYYDVQKKKDPSTGTVDGYIMCGYATFPKFSGFEFNDATDFGMTSTTYCGKYPGLYAGCEDLRRYESGSPYNIYDGAAMPLFTRTDLNGNFDPVNDFKVLPVRGIMRKSIQNSDGSYIGIGYTDMMYTLNTAGGAVTSLTSIPYNPGYSVTDHSIDCNDGYFGGIKGYVMKLNADLTTAWTYVYGAEQEASGLALGNGDIMGIASCTGGYMLVGYDDPISSPGQKSMIIKIDNNGEVLSGWPKNLPTIPILLNVERVLESGTEYFYVLGKDNSTSMTRILKLDANANIIWQTLLASTGVSEFTNVAVSTDGDIFVTTLYGSSGPMIHKLRKSDGVVVNTHTETVVNIYAQDLAYKVVATSDGGCAVTGTVLRYPINNWDIGALPLNYPPGITTPSCNPSSVRWNTDVYVAKFSSSLVKMWSTAFDANTVTPGGSALDILAYCSNVSNTGCPLSSWQIPNQQGLDVSRQECVFGITETPDGGIIVVGKNSRNIDDCYIAKLCGAGSPLLLSGASINDGRRYDHYSINVNNTTLTSTSKVTMESCKYILFDPKTTVSTNAVFTASIDLAGCCNSLYSTGQGLKVTAVLPEPSVAPVDSKWEVESTVFPNPNNGIFEFVIKTAGSDVINLELYDPMGRSIYMANGLPKNGVYSKEINIGANHTSGLHTLRVTSNNKEFTKKIVIQ